MGAFYALAGSRVIQYATPTAGSTVAANSNTTALVLEPAGLLATLTVTMPSGPIDGQVFTVTSTQIVTTLTMSGGTIKSVLASFSANGFASWIYGATGAAWYRIG